MLFKLWKTNHRLVREARLHCCIALGAAGGPLPDELLPLLMDSSLWGCWELEQNDASKEKISQEDPCLLFCLEEIITLKLSLVFLLSLYFYVLFVE